MKKLYICEKPAVARELAAYLGITGKNIEGAISSEDVVVTWCIGHLLQVFDPEDYDPALKSWSLATLPILPDTWMVKVNNAAYISKQFKVIERLLKTAPMVVIATDFDREGELIGRSVLEKCNYKGAVKRILITAHDDRSLEEALKNEFDATKSFPSYCAGLGRQRSDWLIGMNMTRLYTLKARALGFDDVWSVGRVQTATLNLVVERDRSIETFKSQDFYEIVATYNVSGQQYTAKVSVPDDITDEHRRLLDLKLAESIRTGLLAQKEIQVLRVVKKREQQLPPLPLNMSYAQQQASKRWGWTAKKTLETAQDLYEKRKMTSYPRTDSRYLKESMFTEVPDTINGILANDTSCKSIIDQLDLSQKSKAWNDSKITAHHAILPTRVEKGFSDLSEDEKSLYCLIREFFLYQFAPPHLSDSTSIEFIAGEYRLMSKGSCVVDAGWKGIFAIQGDEKDSVVPEIKESETCSLLSVDIRVKKTTPPDHYTDGSLIADMENAAKLERDPELKKRLKETSGIGTEATRANILDVLRHRDLVGSKGSKIISTSKGKALIDAVDVRLKSVGATALMEQALDDIENGTGRLDEYVEAARKMVTELCGNVVDIGLKPDVHSCPECTKPLRRITKRGKDGYDFWGCTGYPACKKSYPNKGSKPDFSGGKK